MKTIKDFVKGEVYNNIDTIRISKIDFITMVYIALYNARLRVTKNAIFNDIIKAYNKANAYVIARYRYIVQDKYFADNIVYIDAALKLEDVIDIIGSYDIRTDYTIKMNQVDIMRLRKLISYIYKSKILTDDDPIKIGASVMNAFLAINCADKM